MVELELRLENLSVDFGVVAHTWSILCPKQNKIVVAGTCASTEVSRLADIHPTIHSKDHARCWTKQPIHRTDIP